MGRQRPEVEIVELIAERFAAEGKNGPEALERMCAAIVTAGAIASVTRQAASGQSEGELRALYLRDCVQAWDLACKAWDAAQRNGVAAEVKRVLYV